MRAIRKLEPERDISREAIMGYSPLRPLGAASSVASRRTSRTESVMTVAQRQSIDHRSASRTDMSTGVRSVHRGFNFSTEEDGVAMQRMQTNLSERRQSSRNLAAMGDPQGRVRKGHLGNVFSVGRGFLRKKASQPKDKD